MAILCLVLPLLALGQEMAVPTDIQAQFLSKMMSFNPSFQPDARPFVIGILYQNKNRASTLAAREFASEAEISFHREYDALPVQTIMIPLDDLDDYVGAIVGNQPDVLYVAPLRAIDIGRITVVTRRHHILTFTGVPLYVEKGISLGVGSRAGRPQILINLQAVQDEGAELSSQLLKLARIIE